MPLYSNYNMFAVPCNEDRLKVGDIYLVKYRRNWYKYGRFHGLQIRSIDYQWCVKRVWFEYDEWSHNRPEMPDNLIEPNSFISPTFKIKF